MQTDKQGSHWGNMQSKLQFKKTPADRFSLFIINVFGSIPFLVFCMVFFAFWVVCNLGMLPGFVPFDIYPFPKLVLVVSMFAIVLSVSVLIGQNRERKMEKIRLQVAFEVNVRAESEITKMLQMLHDIQKHLGIAGEDSELEHMKETLDVQQIQRKMDDMQGQD